MPFLATGAGLGAVGSFVGGGKQASAARDAAQIQASAASNASSLQNQQFQQTLQNQQPWIDAGRKALGNINGLTGDFIKPFDPAQAGLSPNFNYNQADFEMDPAFNETMKYGQQAIERGAAAKGQLLSPSTMKALQSFGQDTAQQYYNQDYNRAQQTYQQNYGNAFNTFTSNQNGAFNKLAQVAGIGQGAVNQTGALGAANATAIGNNMIGAGNASSAGVIGAANGWNNAIGGATANVTNLLGNRQFQNWTSGNGNNGSNGNGSY